MRVVVLVKREVGAGRCVVANSILILGSLTTVRLELLERWWRLTEAGGWRELGSRWRVEPISVLIPREDSMTSLILILLQSSLISRRRARGIRLMEAVRGRIEAIGGRCKTWAEHVTGGVRMRWCERARRRSKGAGVGSSSDV